MILEPTFATYDDKLGRMADYVAALSPAVVRQPTLRPIFVESVVVLTISYLEDFLGALVGTATPEREQVLREWFSRSGNDGERSIARTCDVPILARMARRRISFKRRGAGIETVFQLVFGCSPWSSAEETAVVNDLVLVRQVIVHQGSADLGDYFGQIGRPQLFTTREYQDLRVHRLAHEQVLVLLRDGFLALRSQVQHLKRELLKGGRQSGQL